jgi:hypothetical protein
MKERNSLAMRMIMAVLCAAVSFSACGNGGREGGDGDASGEGGDAVDARDVPAADGYEIPPAPDERARIFVPRIVPDDGSDGIWNYKQRSAIFWFGRVDARNDHVQVRLGYSDRLLMVHCAVFDREIYDDATDTALQDWDSMSFYFDVDGDPDKDAVDANSWRIDSQAGRHGTQQNAIYSGEGGEWSAAPLAIGSSPTETPDLISVQKGYRGEERDQSRGWHLTFYIPWAVLGLSGPPPGEGSALWSAAMTAYDRDSADGSLRGDPQQWPRGFDDLTPSQWGTWEFIDGHFLGWEESGSQPGQGRSAYAIAYAPGDYAPGTEVTVTVREGLDGQHVENACVGASQVLCSGDDEYNFGTGASSWGGNTQRNYFHVQNQEDYADWPCFAKIFLKFPLDKLPAGKVVVSARMVLHHAMPTSGGDEGYHSLIQVFYTGNVLQDGATWWDGTSLNWNNAPVPLENLAGTWGDRTGQGETGWDNLPAWEWDVSRGVARAAEAGDTHVSFAVYSADSEYHTGKQFVQSSDFPDWGDPSQRPTLEITYADFL